jgi:hypothetical protein
MYVEARLVFRRNTGVVMHATRGYVAVLYKHVCLEFSRLNKVYNACAHDATSVFVAALHTRVHLEFSRHNKGYI